MSNSRIFCTAVFVAFGLLCALSNHGVEFGTRAGWSEPAGFAAMCISIACAAVTMFGDRNLR